MKLLGIQLALWLLFILATAHVGVLLVPFGSLLGVFVTLLSPNAHFVAKILTLIAGLLCLSLFIYGIKIRRTMTGILINVAGLYLWCSVGYLSLVLTT